MKNLRYQMINNYIGSKLNNDKEACAVADSILEKIHRLEKEGVMNLEIEEKVLNALYDFSDFIIEMLASCEFLEFKVNQSNDDKFIKEISMFY